MIKLQPIKTADKELYTYMENLLKDSFPKEEYRDLNDLRSYTDNNPMFVNNIILDDEIPVGLLTYWNLGKFFYVEHLAIDSNKRSGGYGKKAVELFCKECNKPIILEVEKPDEEMAKRRIGFYERLDFTLWDNPYKQPPYRNGDEFLPMNVMAYGELDSKKDFERIKEAIYKNVYNQ